MVDYNVKNEDKMVRNLLYSICLHLLFFLLFFFSDNISRNLGKEATNIETLNVNETFLDNNIVSTKDDFYPELTLEEKVNLYELSKKYYDKNKSFSDIEDIKNISETGSEQRNVETNFVPTKSVTNTYVDVLYLGPTDYSIYVKREEDRKKAEESSKLDSLVTTVNEENDKQTQNNAGISNRNEVEINHNIDSKIRKILEKTDLNRLKKEIKKQEREGEKEITVVKEDKEDKGDKQNHLNIDINKIFTREDLKKMREILKSRNDELSLSMREKISIQNQLIVCYKNAMVQTGRNSKVPVSTTIQLFKDGIINNKE
ncbi:MAG: hypothetical protein LBS34_00540, partial [Rickettsiales bacterium]|nr:hypothetical protein [Rickettsiales bacterium]